MSERKLNYLFVFITIALFVLEANIQERYGLFTAFALAVLISAIAFFLSWLSLDGARSAIIVGTVTYGFGGLPAAVGVLVFFASSNLIGFLFGARKIEKVMAKYVDRRTGTQVWANSFWFLTNICLWFLLKADMFIVAAFAAIATANADTWATEVGIRIRGVRTVLITTFKPVEIGTDGGISLPGIVASLVGAGLIGLVSIYFEMNYAVITAIAITSAGFLGSLADSVAGAVYQSGTKALPNLLFSKTDEGNSTVNFLATGFGSLVGLTIYNLLLYGLV